MTVYTETTEDITITVQPVYLDGQSDMLARKFTFAYFVQIHNHGERPVRLLRRHWLIQDGKGDIKEVEGEGVVGKQPLIQPDSAHQYNSFCVLETFEGTMEGTYLIERENGERFKAVIPKFPLRAAAN
jgi:ApaG protein